MRTAQTKQTAQTRSHRPRAITVFAAAFVAGAAAAVGVNRALDVRLAQSKPRVESEAIFVALRSLPQGAAVTVWDVALRDWPKAMMPASALRASDTFSGHVLKHPLREGQPLLSIQLAPAGQGSQPAAAPTAVIPPAAFTQTSTPVMPATDGDLWSPAEPVKASIQTPTHQPVPHIAAPAVAQVAAPAVEQVAAPAVAQPAAPAMDQVAQQNVAPPTPAEPVAVPPQETVAASEQAPTEQAPTEPAAPIAVAAETVVTDSSTPAAEAPATPQPQTGAPEPTATTDVASPPASAATNDIPEPVVATPTAPMETALVAAAPPTQPTPVASPRPTYSRFLVVPESIAVQADASFAARPAAPQQTADPKMPTGQQTASRSGSNAVRPLPSTTTATTTADRGGQARAPQNGPQGRTPQRHGRQAQPANSGTPSNTVPQPRLGSAMFPNLSAGIEAIEGRMRGDQPPQGQTQGQAPTAAQARPLTAR